MSNFKEEALQEFNRWVALTEDNSEMQKELLKLKDNEEELTDSFYKHLHFGTSGIRGILGPGTNRINLYVVRRATQGLSNYLNRTEENPSVVISYDSRKKSAEFAMETAKVLSGNGIKAILFPHLTPVSMLSYAIRYYGCTMGVMITASHNPKIFNGYKVYNREGYQIVGDEPDQILEEINSLDFFKDINMSEDNIVTAGPEAENAFIDEISSFSLLQDRSDILENLKTVYTPLNGAGNEFVKKVLGKCGITNVIEVPSQNYPDEEFTTCPYPNPEKITAYAEAAKIMNKENADLIIATDPDSDRVGVMIPHDGMNVLITGNQIGILMLDYLCHFKKPEKGQFIIKSIATTPFADRIAEKYGLNVINTLTGFKYIGEKIAELTEKGRECDYYFGFEESTGYLVSPFIRDKDGVSGALLIAEAAAWNKSEGRDLLDRLEELYEELGVMRDRTENFIFEGIEGAITMESIMKYFRENIIAGTKMGECSVLSVIDYMGETGLPESDVLEYRFSDGTILLIRPSGTEPKMKLYYFEAEKAEFVRTEIDKIVESFRH